MCNQMNKMIEAIEMSLMTPRAAAMPKATSAMTVGMWWSG